MKIMTRENEPPMTDIFDIILVPTPVLKQAAQPVAQIDSAVRAQMDKMLRTMYAAQGIGLAANQVGLLNRVVVMDIAQREDGGNRVPIFMVNPEIVWKSEEPSIWEEGCLSIPGQYAEIERPRSVKVKYVDYDGHQREAEFSDLGSHCVQHEIDHLNGVLFYDYLSSLKRDMMIRKVKRLQTTTDAL